MIRHHHPRAEFVALPVEELQGVRHEISDRRIAQPTRAVSGVEQGFDLVAIPGQKLLLLVPGERALGGAGLFKDDLTLVLEARDFVGGKESASRNVTK
jgi:hypothetical protein